MIKLIIIILFNSILFGGDFYYNGYVSYHNVSLKGTVHESSDKNQHVDTYSGQLDLTKYYGDFKFNTTIYAGLYETSDGSYLTSPNRSDDFKTSDIFFRSLYLQYKLNENISIGAGVIPFSNSSPIEYTYGYNPDGEGINIINDSEFLAVYGIYRWTDDGNHKIIFGYGTQDQGYVPMGDYITKSLNEDNRIGFLLYEYQDMKNKFILEYLNSNVKYQTIPITRLELFGMHYSYNDSLESGYSFYGQLGASRYHSYSVGAKDPILKANKIPGYVVNFMPEQFQFDESKRSWGYASLLGVRKDFDIMNNEFYVNFEWFRTYDNFVSGNHGTPYLGIKSNNIFNIRDNAYFLNLGYNLNRYLTFRVYYEYLEFEETKKVGSFADYIDTKKYLGTKTTRTELLGVSVSYKF